MACRDAPLTSSFEKIGSMNKTVTRVIFYVLERPAILSLGSILGQVSDALALDSWLQALRSSKTE